MMDRNREARRAAAMANGLPRRRHRTTTGSLRDSPEDDGPMELQETARLRDRTAKKDRSREIRDRDRDRDRERDRDQDRERERLSRSKRRRGVDKYMHGSNREDGGGGVDDSSEESVNEEDDDGPVRYNVPTTSSNPVPMSSSSPASSTLTSHRKSYPPPTKVFRTSTAPTWKAPDEMIGVSVPRKARSASTKRSHDCWSSGGGGSVVGGEQLHRQASSSPVRSTMAAAVVGPPPAPPPVPSSIPAPMSPSSSSVSIKKKIKPNCPKQKPPKSSSSCPKSSPSPSSIQDEIEIEVAEVLYGLMRQSQAPCSSKQEGLLSNDLATRDINRSTGDSKSRVSSPISAPPQNTSSSAPFTTVAPKRKRPRPYPEENPRSSPIPKLETDQPVKLEVPLPGSAAENGDLLKSNDPTPPSLEPVANGVSSSDAKPVVMEESVGMVAKVEEASSTSPNTESQDHHHVESASTSTKPTSTLGGEKETHREEKFEIDLMALPPQSRGSPERGEAEYGGDGGGMNMMGGDEKSMVTDREAEGKAKGVGRANEEGDGKAVVVNVNSASSAEPETQTQAEPKSKAKANGAVVVGPESEPHKQPSLPPQHQHHHLNVNDQNHKERNIDLQLDLEKSDRPSGVNDPKLNLHKHPPPKPSKDDAFADIKPGGGQVSSVPLAMSVPAGWPGGLGPMGYMAPLQGAVSMDASTMASSPMQPKPKRCATHCYIARSISAHQQMMKMNPFWPAPGSAPLYGAKPPYNLNMVPPADLHAAATATARGTVVNSAQDNTNKAGDQPFAFFPGQPASKDKSPQPAIAPDSAQKKQQFLLPQSLPPGTPSNVLHGPAFFFPFGQQQPAAAAAAARLGSGKSPSTGGSAAVSTATTTTAPMGSSSTPTPAAGPAMSFSYPNMAGNEAQFMAILGNGAYPFPIPAHVGAASPYRGSHPQAMSFFNGSFYSSQMLHPSQLQQQQQQQSAAPSQSLQIQQQQSHQNPSLSTASSSSQKQQHLQNQQQRPQGSSANGGTGTSNQSMQNFQGAKGRTSHDMGGEDSPSTADSRNRPNLGVYGQNFAMPFHHPNFALMTPPSSLGPGVASAASGGNHGDNKKQQQQQQQQSQQQPFPMSFASINGSTTPGGALDISSMAHNHAIIQSLPEAARQNYQMMAAAAQAAQAAQQKKNNYRGPEDVKTGAGPDSSNAEEERKVMGSRASAASVGQSIAFSRDLANNSIPGSNVVDSSARSLNLVPGSSRPARSSGPNTMTNPNVSTSQQLQQQQQQMLFPKQQQFGAATVAAARNKTPATSNGSVFPDHLTSSSVMAAKFPNALPSFPPLVQSSGGAPSQSTQWKNSVRPNTTTQVSSPSIATSAASTIKNLSQQQGRPQQSHTQISFGPAPTNPKPSTPSQGQQGQSSNQAPSQPMIVGSPSTSSVSKNACGSPRTTATSASAGNKSGAQGSTLSSQQGKNSPSPSLSSQKPSILGSPHMMSTSSSVSKPQLPESMQQQPLLSKQNIQQAQLFFSNYMQQASVNASTGGGYYLQRHKPDNQQQQQQGQKSQGSGVPTSSSGMLSLCTPVSLANTSTSDPAKAVAAAAAAAAAANGMKGGLPQQGIFHAAQFAQSAGGTHQLVPAGFPYVHAVPTVQVKPAEQKQPAGNDNLNACWQPEKKK